VLLLLQMLLVLVLVGRAGVTVVIWFVKEPWMLVVWRVMLSQR
jgi:hypothetical protein